MDRIQKPTQDELKISAKTTVISGIFQMLFLLGVFVVPLDKETGFSFINDFIEGYERFDNPYTIFRFLTLAALVASCIITAIHSIKCLFSDNTYELESDDSKCGFMRFYSKMFYFGLLRAACWVAYIVVVAFGAEHGYMDLLSQNLTFVTYMVVSIVLWRLGSWIAGRKAKLVDKYYVAVINREMEEEAKAEKEEKEAQNLSDRERIENFDVLIKYKKLYDDGAITEEEYEEKKKTLMK